MPLSRPFHWRSLLGDVVDRNRKASFSPGLALRCWQKLAIASSASVLRRVRRFPRSCFTCSKRSAPSSPLAAAAWIRSMSSPASTQDAALAEDEASEGSLRSPETQIRRTLHVHRAFEPCWQPSDRSILAMPFNRRRILSIRSENRACDQKHVDALHRYLSPTLPDERIGDLSLVGLRIHRPPSYRSLKIGDVKRVPNTYSMFRRRRHRRSSGICCCRPRTPP